MNPPRQALNPPASHTHPHAPRLVLRQMVVALLCRSQVQQRNLHARHTAPMSSCDSWRLRSSRSALLGTG
eukprot:8921758-Pyramimonas_sp.AAC.1